MSKMTNKMILKYIQLIWVGAFIANANVKCEQMRLERSQDKTLQWRFIGCAAACMSDNPAYVSNESTRITVINVCVCVYVLVMRPFFIQDFDGVLSRVPQEFCCTTEADY